MTFRAAEVYELLEPLLKDYRKLRLRHTGGYTLTFMDEFVDSLLREERVCDIIMPRIGKRETLEENGELGPRKSLLLDAMEGKSEHGSERGRSQTRSPRSSRGRSPSGSTSRSINGVRGASLSKSRSRSRTPSETGSRYVSRSPSRSHSRSPVRSHSRSISPDRMDADKELPDAS